MPHDPQAWTTAGQAQATIADAKALLQAKLRRHAETLTKAAASLDAPPASGGFKTPGVFGGGRNEELLAVLLAQGADALSEAAFQAQMSFLSSWDGSCRKEKLDAMRTLEQLMSLKDSASARLPETPVRVPLAAAEGVRALLGHSGARLFAAGDRVAFEHEGASFEGEILAIDDGIAAIAHLSRQVSCGSSSERGMVLKPIAEIDFPEDRY